MKDLTWHICESLPLRDKDEDKHDDCLILLIIPNSKLPVQM